MEAEAKRSRINSLLAVRAPARSAERSGGVTQQQTLFSEEKSICISSAHARARGGSKLDRIQDILNTAPAARSAGSGAPARKEAARVFRNGWFETGWPKRKEYTTAELIQWWKILWMQTYGEEPESFGVWMFQRFYIRRHLLKWLLEDGHERAEAVIEYAFRNWNALRKRFAIDVEKPELNVVYGYRRPIMQAMDAEGKGRKWAPDWSQERVYDETEVAGELLL